MLGMQNKRVPLLLLKFVYYVKATNFCLDLQKLPILPSKKTTKRGGGGQKSPIVRRHSLWTAPYLINEYTQYPIIRNGIIRNSAEFL